MTTILFVCIHNSARSQMAEAFVNAMASDRMQAQSAGLEAGSLNPRVVAVMAESGIDISLKRSKTVQEMLEAKKSFDYVVTVCDAAAAERCPLFPGRALRRTWSFPDPSSLQGDEEHILESIRIVRDQIKQAVQELIVEIDSLGAGA